MEPSLAIRKFTTECEICATPIHKIRHKHHLIPRVDPRSTNKTSNLAYICPTCHSRVHAHEIIIEGVFSTTDGDKLFWHYKDEDYIVRPGIILLPDGTAEIVEE